MDVNEFLKLSTSVKLTNTEPFVGFEIDLARLFMVTEESTALTICFSAWGLGLVFKAHRLLYHSTPGLRVIKKMKKFGVWGSDFGN